jgi:hypothetical protein
MKDLAIALDNRPGALAEMGDALGEAGVSVEGGGCWLFEGKAVAHFLFTDGTAACEALESAGFRVLAEREVLVQENQLILVVDDIDKGRKVSEAWSAKGS